MQTQNINSTQFHLDLRDCLEDQPEQLDDQVQQYNTKLHEDLDKHAPIREKKIRDSHYQPWFNDRIKNCLKKEKRKNLVKRPIRIFIECILHPT